MATVYERFIKLGLAHSNPILQLAGQHVKEHFSYVSFVKRQERQGKHFYFVNDYDSTVTERIDKVILEWVKHKPGMFERYQTHQWWRKYKGLDEDCLLAERCWHQAFTRSGLLQVLVLTAAISFRSILRWSLGLSYFSDFLNWR